MIALRATAPLHHPLNCCAIIGGALRRVLVDAFVSRFGRLQDTVGDKLLPAWRSAVGETPATVADNLDRAERLGLIPSADLWLGLRRLRNQMVHEYIEDPSVLSNALNTAHTHLTVLTDAADALLADLAQRGVI